MSLATGHPEFREELLEAHATYHEFARRIETQQALTLAGTFHLELQRFRRLTTQYVLQVAAWCGQIGETGEALLSVALAPVATLFTLREPANTTEAPPSSEVSTCPVERWSAVTPHTPVPEVA